MWNALKRLLDITALKKITSYLQRVSNCVGADSYWLISHLPSGATEDNKDHISKWMTHARINDAISSNSDYPPEFQYRLYNITQSLQRRCQKKSGSVLIWMASLPAALYRGWLLKFDRLVTWFSVICLNSDDEEIPLRTNLEICDDPVWTGNLIISLPKKRSEVFRHEVTFLG